MKRDFRSKPRRQVRYRAWLKTAPGSAILPCYLYDVSENGARLMIDGAKALPPEVILLVAQQSEGRPCKVVWRSETELGVSFKQPATLGYVRRKA